MNNWPWEELGLSGPAELPEIRRAYAERLKETPPEENPEGFQRLHDAYQTASRLARRRGADTAGRVGGEEEPPGDVSAKQWDFERLFAEGAAEERGRRFQKLWALRQSNHARYEAWNPAPSGDPAEAALVWIAVARALSIVEELISSGAELPFWNTFCKSELFLYVRNQPDFVFALEDLLRECADFPETGRRVLFRAYGFDARPVAWELRPLRQLLGAGIPDGHTPTTRFLFLLLTLVVLTANLFADSLALQSWRNGQVLDWMEADFGRAFILAETRDWGTACTLLDTRTGCYFGARWDGPRDTSRGRRGYVTDYTRVRMFREIAGFAERRACAVFPERDAGDPASAGENWGETYLRFPLTGAGEEISDLGELLSEIREAPWYRELPPECVLYLCWQDWSFYAYDARTDDFDGYALRRYYERFFGPDLCRIALEETGIAAADMGADCLLFTESGTVKLENRDFFHVVGVEKAGFRPRYHYFLSLDGKELFRVPTGGKVSELTLQELYRMDKADYDVKGFSETLSVFRDAKAP